MTDLHRVEIVSPGADAAQPQLAGWGDDPYHRAQLLAGAFIAGYANPGTRTSYAADLRYWFGFLGRMGVADPLVVHRSHGELYCRELEMGGRVASTVFRRTSTVITFYQYVVDEEILARNPLARMRRPKVPKDSPRQGLTRTELADWLDAAQAEGGQVYALACLLGINALRISEACSSNVEDLGEQDCHHVLHVIRKGPKRATIVLPARTMQAVVGAVGDRTTGPLLLHTRGGRMTREASQRIVTRLCKTAGITKKIVNHSLRHSAITAALNAGASIRDVADYAGHEDLKTTARYDRDRNNLNRSAAYLVSQYVGGAV